HGGLVGAARGGARPLRSGTAGGALRHSPLPVRLAWLRRVAEPPLGELGGPRALVLGPPPPASRGRLPRGIRRDRAGRDPHRGEPLPALGDPDRGRRADLQPAYRDPLRARAGADRGRDGPRFTSGGLELG